MNKTIRRDVTIEDCVLLIAWAAFFLPPIIPRISSAASHALSLAGYAAFLVLLIYRKKEFPVKTDVLLYLVFLGYCILILILKSPEKFPLIARRNLLPASIFLIKWTFDRNPRGLGLLYHLCSFYIYFNFLTLILYPDGIIKSSIGSSVERAQWLLGSKNNIPLYMILFTTIAAYYYYTVRRTRNSSSRIRSNILSLSTAKCDSLSTSPLMLNRMMPSLPLRPPKNMPSGQPAKNPRKSSSYLNVSSI